MIQLGVSATYRSPEPSESGPVLGPHGHEPPVRLTIQDHVTAIRRGCAFACFLIEISSTP